MWAPSRPSGLVPAACAALVVYACARSFYDADGWWILATGREVVGTGLAGAPEALGLSSDAVLQQWLFDAVAWIVWDRFSDGGLAILCAACAALACIPPFLMARMLGLGKTRHYVCGLFAILCACPYFSVRPTALSIALAGFTLAACIAYQLGQDARLLAAPVACSLLGANVQSALCLLPASICLAFALGSIIDKRPGAPLAYLGTAAASSFTTLLNPYGVKATIYLFDSYPIAASPALQIKEMQCAASCPPIALLCTAMGACLVLAMAHYAKGRMSSATPLLLAAAGTLACALNIRNLWVLGILSLPLFHILASHTRLPPTPNLLRIPARAACLTTLLFIAYVIAPIPPNQGFAAEPKDSLATPAAAARFLASANGIVGNDPVSGGYLEFCGIKPSTDMRPELWGDASCNQCVAWCQADSDPGMAESFLAGCKADYLLTAKDGALTDSLERSETWISVLAGDGWALFSRATSS